MMQPSLYARCLLYWKHVECCWVWIVPTPSVRAYFCQETCWCAVVSQVAPLELVTGLRVLLFYAVEQSVVGLQCYDPGMGQGDGGVLTLLLSGVGRRFGHWGFFKFILSCAFHMFSHIWAYRHLVEFHWSSVDGGLLGSLMDSTPRPCMRLGRCPCYVMQY